MTRKLALLGRSPKTKMLIHQAGVDEVWSIGVAHRDHVEEGGIPNHTRLYEMHPIWMLRSPMYDETHWQEITAGLGVDVWMIEPTDEIPRSLRYPIEEVVELAGLNLVRLDEGGQRANPVLTFSGDFMMAHALLDGDFGEVHLYGLDMETRTEYQYQRPGFAFWMGKLSQAGIKVVLPDGSPLLAGKIYGYEGAQKVTEADLEDFRRTFDRLEAPVVGRLRELGVPAHPPEHQEEVNGLLKRHMVIEGARQVTEDILAKGGVVGPDGRYVTRQKVEYYRGVFTNQFMEHQANVNWWRGALHVLEQNGRGDEFMKGQKAISDSMKMQSLAAGAYHVLNAMVMICDNQQPDLADMLRETVELRLS